MCTYLCFIKYINNCGMIYSWFVLHKIIFVEVHLWLVETLCCRAIGSKFYVFQVHRLLFPWFILSLKVYNHFKGLSHEMDLAFDDTIGL